MLGKTCLRMCHEALEIKDQSTLTLIVANFPPPFWLKVAWLCGRNEVGWKRAKLEKFAFFERKCTWLRHRRFLTKIAVSRLSSGYFFLFSRLHVQSLLRFCAPPWKSCQANKESLDLFAFLSLLETWPESYLIPSCATSCPFLPSKKTKKGVLIEKKSLIYLGKIHLMFKKFTYK